MKEIVRRDRVFDDVEVGRALLKMLALSACILRSNLVAVNALHRKTLNTFGQRACFSKSSAPVLITYFVLFFRTELNKSCMYVVQGWGREG